MTMADALFDCVEEIKRYEGLFPGAYTEHSQEIEELKKSITELQVRLDGGGVETIQNLNEGRKER